MSNPAPDILKKFVTSKRGLTTKEAGKRLARFGENILPFRKAPSKISLFLEQLKSPLVYVLLGASLITIFLKDFIDTIVILLAVFVNIIISFFQEYKAQNALLALKKIFTPHALVLRDGEEVEIEARFLVPGDIIILEAGRKVPADGVVIESTDLHINEAVLTGEAEPVIKSVQLDKKSVKSVSQVFMATEIVLGYGKVVITKTGLKTEVGKIATMLKETREEKTPLQKRLGKLSGVLAVMVGIICLLILVTGLGEGRPFLEMFTAAVAVAVAAIPEGLVVSLTVILALGMQRIFKKNAVVRKLVAAETLGSTTIICADKTGTLTEGKMKVVRWKVLDSGEAIKCAVLCNDLKNPTEIALWEKVRESNHFDPQKIYDENPRLAEIPFSSERKFMAVAVRQLGSEAVEQSGNKRTAKLPNCQAVELFIKGAPEKILSWCKMGIEERKEWQQLVESWGSEGLRMIALAYKFAPSEPASSTSGPPAPLSGVVPPERSSFQQDSSVAQDLLHASLGHGFTFLGLVAFFDPLRPEVKKALEQCQKAGIKVAVVTGDYRQTAENVMEKLGIKPKAGEIMEGRELENLGEEELIKRIKGIKLFARTTPSQKLKIVSAFKKHGEVVAMTGDGINDAPALKKADIGIVVGEATEVAKETADMVLLDSNFKTIVDAVEQGRIIFANIKKVVLYLLVDSFTEVILIGGSLLFKFPLPLLSSQILWVNLVEDGLPGMALAFEEEEKEVMDDPPRKKEEPILDLEMKVLIFIIGIVTDLLLFLVFFYFWKVSNDLFYTRTVVFAGLGIDSLLYVFSCRSLRHSIFQKNPFSNKFLVFSVFLGLVLLLAALHLPILQMVLKTQALGVFEWLVLLGLGLFEVFTIELTKWVFIVRKKHLLEG